MLRELEDGWRGGKLRLVSRHAGEALAHADGFRQLRAVQLCEVRLVVEQIELRRRAVLEEVDDALGLGRKVRETGEAAHRRRRLRLLGEQRSQRGHADAGAGAAEEMPARNAEARLIEWVHCLVTISSMLSSRLATDA